MQNALLDKKNVIQFVQDLIFLAKKEGQIKQLSHMKKGVNMSLTREYKDLDLLTESLNRSREKLGSSDLEKALRSIK